MATSFEQVQGLLAAEEPDYEQGAALGPDAVPFLGRLVAGGDPMMASKAAYLVGMIGGPRAMDVLQTAAHSDQAIVRLATAATARNLSHPAASQVVKLFVTDADPGVRRAALESVSGAVDRSLENTLTEMAGSDPDPSIRYAADAALARIAR